MLLMPIKTVIIVLLLLTNTTFVLAKDSDKSQTINIWADSFIADKQNNSAVYNGNVRFEQGTIKISTDRLEIEYKNDSFENMIMQSETLSSFEQLDNNNELIKATAKQIIYQNKTNEVFFIGNVTFNQGGNVFQAESMQLNTDTKKLVTNKDNNQENSNRVFISIQPE